VPNRRTVSSCRVSTRSSPVPQATTIERPLTGAFGSGRGPHQRAPTPRTFPATTPRRVAVWSTALLTEHTGRLHLPGKYVT
jgi:hypothetical protein